MIKDTELKKGNYFNEISRHTEIHLPTISIFKIVEIHLFEVETIPYGVDILKAKGYHTIKMSDLSPILLTPEILEKCGLEKWENSNIFSIDFKDGQSIQVRPERKEVVMFGSDAATDGHGFVIDNIEFLHQLQNIFGTIGKELEIKLQPDALP